MKRKIIGNIVVHFNIEVKGTFTVKMNNYITVLQFRPKMKHKLIEGSTS